MKVYCKNSIDRFIPNGNNLLDIKRFKFGEFYNITDDLCFINHQGVFNYIYIEGIIFWNEKTNDNLYFFDDYFYTLKESRKIKLDMIKGEGRR